jgi:hypothetical protein
MSSNQYDSGMVSTVIVLYRGLRSNPDIATIFHTLSMSHLANNTFLVAQERIDYLNTIADVIAAIGHLQ